MREAEAQRASELAPSLSLTSSILGFSALANFDFAAARAAFEKAAALNPGDPLPHLGLGLTSIRSGELENGRREMAIAVALDPESSVARSYLGKTYATLGLYEPTVRGARSGNGRSPRRPTPKIRPPRSTGRSRSARSIGRSKRWKIFRNRLS